jgi:preprotein translocase subunit SecF
VGFQNNMWIIKNNKIFLAISGVFIVASIVAVSVFGLKVGIDFKGGSLTEISYVGEKPTIEEIQKNIESLAFGETLVQPVGEDKVSIKSRSLSENERQELISNLSFNEKYKVEEQSFTSVGPSVGKELKKRAIISLTIVEITMILFIAYAFRKVSKPVSSWKFGLVTIVTLLHDVIMSVGVFSLVSYLTGAEANTLFVVALLTVQGLSVNDTIVMFDRIRENLLNKTAPDFKTTVGKSIDQTIVRSLNTSLSTIIVLLCLVFFGPESTRVFSLILAAGMFFGTYSSIFIASPLLVLVEKWQKKGAS